MFKIKTFFTIFTLAIIGKLEIRNGSINTDIALLLVKMVKKAKNLSPCGSNTRLSD